MGHGQGCHVTEVICRGPAKKQHTDLLLCGGDVPSPPITHQVRVGVRRVVQVVRGRGRTRGFVSALRQSILSNSLFTTRTHLFVATITQDDLEFDFRRQ